MIVSNPRLSPQSLAPNPEPRTMRTPIRLTALTLTLLTITACAGDDTAAPAWTVTEDTLSGGATLVVNTPPASGIEPTWVIEEELRIGTMEGEGPSQFGQLRGIAVTGDGQIAVLDAQAKQVRVFDEGGAHLATYGREGAGPGELRGPWGLMRDDRDRLWVPDHSNDRMSIYDPAGGFETSYPFPVLRYGFIWEGVMLDDGRIVKPSITLAPERRDLLRVYSPEMELVDSILEPLPEGPPVDRTNPPSSFYWEAPGGLPRGYMGVPFYPRGQRVFDPSGDIWMSTPGDAAYRITRTTLRGDTTLVIETRRAPVPVPDAVRDSAIDAIRAALLERAPGAAEQDWSKVPRVMPAVEAMFVAEDGRLWVRTASRDSLIHYDIYERNGHHAGTAVTAISLWPWVSPVVRGDRLWGIVTDELDVQYVVRGRLGSPVGGEG